MANELKKKCLGRASAPSALSPAPAGEANRARGATAHMGLLQLEANARQLVASKMPPSAVLCLTATCKAAAAAALCVDLSNTGPGFALGAVWRLAQRVQLEGLKVGQPD